MATSMNFEPPPSDMAKRVPKLSDDREPVPKSLLGSNLVGYDAVESVAQSDRVAGQELAQVVSAEPLSAEIAQISGQFLIARKSPIGQEIGHPVKK